MIRLFFTLMLIASAPFSVCFADSQDTETRIEFQKRKEKLEARYIDFYKHKKKSYEFEILRNSGIEEIKQKRQKFRQVHEVARRKQIKTRDLSRDDITLSKLTQTTDPDQLAKETKLRKGYVKKRNELRRFEAKQKKIPEELELGLKAIFESL